MLIILGLLIISFLGYQVINTFDDSLFPLERLSLSFLLGLGLFTNIIFLFSLVGMQINLHNTIVILLLLIFLLSIFNWRKRKFFIKGKLSFLPLKISKLEKMFIGAILLFLILSLVISIYWPISIWDALALYDFRAKIIFETGYFHKIASNFEYFSHYPLFTSLSHVIVYLLGGTNPQFIYSLMFGAYAAVFYSALKRFSSSRVKSLLLTLLVVTWPSLFNHSTFAYTNLPYTIYLTSAFFYLYTYIRKKNIGYLILSAIMLGLSTWTRDAEPFWMVAFMLLAGHQLLIRRVKPIFYYAISFFAIQIPWRQYQAHTFGPARSTQNQIISSANVLVSNLNIDRIRLVSAYIYGNIVEYWGFALIGLVVFIFIFENIRSIRNRTNLFFLIIFLSMILMMVSIYIFSIIYPGWAEIPGSARRMSMFFVPLFIFYIGTTGVFNHVFELISFNKKHKSKRRYVGKKNKRAL